MQKVLRKRVLRDLKENLFRYIALAFLIIMGMYVIVSLIGAGYTIIDNGETHDEANKIEDGQFSVFVPLSDEEISRLEDAGAEVEGMFYEDYDVMDGKTIRVFANRENIDLVECDEGNLAEADDEIVVEKRFSQVNDISVGDIIQIAGNEFKVTGIGTSPDYNALFKEMSDTVVDSKMFGTVFVTEGAYDKLHATGESVKTETYLYAFRLKGKTTCDDVKDALEDIKVDTDRIDDEYFQEYWDRTGAAINDFKDGIKDLKSGANELADGVAELKKETDSFLKDYDTDLANITSFVTSDDNPRTGGAADDQQINVQAGYFFGVLLMLLFTYVISVFVVHGIEKESSVIGALYALGVKRRDLMMHYLTLPVIVTTVAGIIGFLIGISNVGIPVQMADAYAYYSIPAMDVKIPPILIVYGIVMPPLTAIVVNYFVIRKKLSQTALSLIKNEVKQPKGSNVDLGDMGFVGRFRVRQMLREMRTGLTVVIGMFIALICLMLSLNTATFCSKVKKQNVEDTHYEYMYTYKYPTENPPEGGEAAYAKTLKKEVYGYNWDVTVLGLSKNTKYFDVDLKDGKNRVAISSSFAEKYCYSVGDEIVLHDEENDIDYGFTVDSVTQYTPAFYVFMTIDDARELFGAGSDEYNVVFSDKDLEVDPARLYATTTKADIESAAGIFADQMRSMVVMIVIISTLIFVVVMYLMMKVMIDRSAFSISLIKVFGFRTKEIRKLYLDGNFFIIAIGAAICLPLAKLIMSAVYPSLVSNVNCGVKLTFAPWLWAALYGGILVLYFIINRVLVGRLNKIVPAEVLKNRE
ncbi:MAG TPA: ABC transporter permease [Coprococcus sp.]|jgi:X-X-X-Leu-X-X-Gly heptad repeat protein|uniref:ABC transporter permease n=1 Tax=Coprococcus eutactus TaxID=33043 RepID=UPI000E8A850C|nr:ABC transporter permease [Coprococcus eutactus]MCG4691839.1 ABC transporter permease [Coprococcus eutactus]HAQ91618.1 ABC transporter permease [Coprococcus sp.]HBN41402.1 ABC transporter permease [Coprococcus sp.]